MKKVFISRKKFKKVGEELLHNELYISQVVCPICEKTFSAIRIKTSGYKLDHTDEDFCMHYVDLNPLIYEVWICNHCGHADFGTIFDKITPLEKIRVQPFCLSKFIDVPGRNPFELKEYHKAVYNFFDMLSSDGDREETAAIESYKILLLNLEARMAPDSLKAKAVMRIGWLYRMMKDPKELEYLKMAADYFASAFEKEAMESGKFDAATCAYMAGELYRRVDDITKAQDWFRKALTEAQKADNKAIADKARDQIQVTKDAK